MGALRNNQRAFTTSVQRLSTGLRVNSASDDPSSFMKISEMKNEISLTSELMRDTQESINYMKTADSGLAEIGRLLDDANAIANAASNDATLTSDQRTNYQNEISSILTAIDNIAQYTKYGDVPILDGSAGLYAGSTAANTVESMSFTGNLGGYALTTNATVCIAIVTAAAIASVGTKTFATSGTLIGAGSFSINGTVFTTSGTDTISDVVSRINEKTTTTNVYANGTSGVVSLVAMTVGSDAKVELVDASSLLLDSSATYCSQAGVDAAAVVSVYSGSQLAVSTFTLGSGRELKDSDGNFILLAAAGAMVTDTTERAVGQVIKGSATFVIDNGSTSSISIGNFMADQLGTGVVASTDLKDISVSSASSASTAISVINQAQSEISQVRSRIATFEKYVLQTSYNNLQTRNTYAELSRSNLEDADMAVEASTMSKSLMVQESAVSLLGKTDLIPRAILSLISR